MELINNLISYATTWPAWIVSVIIIWGVSAPVLALSYWLAKEIPEGHDWE